MEEGNELLTQEGGDIKKGTEYANEVNFISPEKWATIPNTERKIDLEQCKTSGFNLVFEKEEKACAQAQIEHRRNPYAKRKKKQECDDDSTKPEGGKKLRFEAKQTTVTIFCKNCMMEHNKKSLDRYYKCNLSTCGRLIKDEYSDEDKMMPGEDLKEKEFDDLQKHFHAIEYAIVDQKGPNKNTVNALFKLRDKAMSEGILPKDYYVDKYEDNHTMTSAVRAVAQSLEKRDRTQFRFSYHALMYLIIMGNYGKFDPK